MNASEAPDHRRIPWLDHARGLAIVLVVLGHALATADSEGRLYSTIYSFHMPLFFALSGFAGGVKPQDDIAPTAWKLTRRLLFPFMFFGLLTLCYYALSQKATSSHLPDADQIGLAAVHIFYGVCELMPIKSPLWFFPCMFVTMLFSLILTKMIGIRSAFAVTIAAAVAILRWPLPFRPPWSADTAVIGACFFQLGMMLRYRRFHQAIDRTGARPAMVILGVACLVATAFLAARNTSVDMAAIRFGNLVLFFASACLGIMGVVGIAGILPAIPFKRLSDDARVIFPLHLLFFSVTTAFVTIVLQVDRHAFQNSFYAAVIYTTLSIVGSVFAAKLLRMVLPEAIGEPRVKR